MERVLREACHVPSDSELASLFALIDRMKRDRTLTNANHGIVHRTVMERLKTYWVRCEKFDDTRTVRENRIQFGMKTLSSI